MLPADHAERMERAKLALEGLSVGDAFGAQFFLPANARLLFGPKRKAPPGEWTWTDDTMMALSIHDVLDLEGGIDRDKLARLFAGRFVADYFRGYGPGAIRILNKIDQGTPWRVAAGEEFGGQGSLGNGSAMRVAPVAGYFADDLGRVVEQATRSAEVTHAHAEGIAGGIAAAVAGAAAWRLRDADDPEACRCELFEAVLAHTPAGDTRRGVEQAYKLAPERTPDEAATILGNGSRVTCPDTVPFCVWVAGRHLHNYADALWTTIRAGGDIDTTGAIVGGIVALAAGWEGIPEEWRERRERLP